MYPDEPDDHHIATPRQRGRRSAAAASVLRMLPDVKLARPEPPARLSEAEKSIWIEQTQKLRPGWFYGAEPLLEVYVKLLAEERELAVLIGQTERGSRRYVDLMRLRLATIMTAGNIGGKLTLTVRASTERRAPKLVPPGRRPWETDDNPEPAA